MRFTLRFLLALSVFCTVRTEFAFSQNFTQERTIKTPHLGKMYGFSLAPDGKTFVTGGDDGKIIFWNLETGSLKQEIDIEKETGSKAVNKVAFAPNGKIVAVASGKFVLVYEPETAVRISALSVTDEIWGLAFSPDGRWLAGGGAFGNLYVWEVTKNYGLLKLIDKAHAFSIFTLAFSRDSKYLVSGSDGPSGEDHSVRIWNLETWKNDKTITDHTDGITCVTFSPNNQFLATASYDKSLKVYSTNGWKPVFSHSADEPVHGLAFSPDNRWLAVGLTGDVSMFSVAEYFDLSELLSNHFGKIFEVGFTTDGRFVSSSAIDRNVTVWKPSDMAEAVTAQDEIQTEVKSSWLVASKSVETGHEEKMYAMDLSVTGDLLATGADDGIVRIWDLSQNALAYSIPIADDGSKTAINNLRFSNTGRLLAVATGRYVKIIEPVTGNLVTILVGTEDVWGLAFSPDDSRLAGGDAKGQINIWNISQHYSHETVFPAHGFSVFSLAFSGDGKFLVSGADGHYKEDHSVKVWNVGEWSLVQTLKHHGDGVTQVAFSPDNRLLATSSYDGSVNIHETATWEKTGGFYSKGDLHGVSFSHDGRWLALASNDGVLLLKGTDDFTLLNAMREHGNNIFRIAFSADGTLAASITEDKKAIIYSPTVNPLASAVVTIDETMKSKQPLIKTASKVTPGAADTVPPEIVIFKPSVKKGITISTQKKIETVEGKAKDESGIFEVRINGIDAAVDASGRFRADVPLKVGDNQIVVEAFDLKKNKATKVFTLERESAVAEEVKTEPGGRYHLVAIGINAYKHWNQLNNAVKDAEDVVSVLTEKYQFSEQDVTRVFDQQATRENIYAVFKSLAEKVSEKDWLLVYFSGHGHYDKTLDEGYWIPVDAKRGSEIDYVPNSTLLKYLKAINSKHTFLVADACFSGSLFSQSSRGYVENVEKFKSRWGLTSGRLEAVSDGSVGNNSPFASYFLKFLKSNQEPRVPVSELVQYVKVAVANNSDQTPIGNPIRNVGDEGGEFIFIRTDAE